MELSKHGFFLTKDNKKGVGIKKNTLGSAKSVKNNLKKEVNL